MPAATELRVAWDQMASPDRWEPPDALVTMESMPPTAARVWPVLLDSRGAMVSTDGQACKVHLASKVSRASRAAPAAPVSTAGTACKGREDRRAVAATPGLTALTDAMLLMEAKAPLVLLVPAAPRDRWVLLGAPENGDGQHTQ